MEEAQGSGCVAVFSFLKNKEELAKAVERDTAAERKIMAATLETAEMKRTFVKRMKELNEEIEAVKRGATVEQVSSPLDFSKSSTTRPASIKDEVAQPVAPEEKSAPKPQKEPWYWRHSDLIALAIVFLMFFLLAWGFQSFRDGHPVTLGRMWEISQKGEEPAH